MRLLFVLVLVLFSTIWFMSVSESQTLTNCGIHDIGLFDNTLPLKIESCNTLRHVLMDRLEDLRYTEDSVKPYVEQYVKRCTKPVEYEIIKPLEIEVSNP